MFAQNHNNLLYAVVDVKLGAIAAAASGLPPWYETWVQLGPGSTKEARLAVYRAVRAAGCLPDEAGFFLVAWMLDQITEDRADVALRLLEDGVELLPHRPRRNGDRLQGAVLRAQVEREIQRCRAAWDRLFASVLEELGERDLAELFRANKEEFLQRYERGRRFFCGQLPGQIGHAGPWSETDRS